MPIKWCLLLYARQHLQGAFIICKVPSPALSLLARCFLITLCQLQGSSSFDTRGFVCLSTFKDYNFPHQVAFPKKRSSLSHLASRDDLLPHQDRRRALRVPLGTTQEEFPFAIDSKFSYLPFLPSSPSGGVFPSTSTFGFSFLPSITISVTTCRLHARSELTNDARSRQRNTTKLRVYANTITGQHPAKARRAAVIDSRDRPAPVSMFQLQMRKISK